MSRFSAEVLEKPQWRKLGARANHGGQVEHEIEHGSLTNLELEGNQTWNDYLGLLRSRRSEHEITTRETQKV